MLPHSANFTILHIEIRLSQHNFTLKKSQNKFNETGLVLKRTDSFNQDERQKQLNETIYVSDNNRFAPAWQFFGSSFPAFS